MVYITLAVISIFLDLPIKVTNSVAFGAVMLSISEVLVLINCRRIKKRSFVRILENPELDNKTLIARSYINEILDEKISELKAQNTILFYISFGLKSIAIFSIILLQYFPKLPPFFESNKFGVFCTVISLGIIFMSFYFDSSRKDNEVFDDMNEIMDCYEIVFDEKNAMSDKYFKSFAHSKNDRKKKNEEKKHNSKNTRNAN